MYLASARGAVVVVREIERFLATELRAVAFALIADHGLHRELQPADESTATAIDRPIRRTRAAAFAMSELADHLVLALFDFLLSQIDRRRSERRRLRRMRAELATAHKKSGGHEAGTEGEAKDGHNHPFFTRFVRQGKPCKCARPAGASLTKSGTRRELPDGELSAHRVRELLKFDRNETCGFVFVSYVRLC